MQLAALRARARAPAAPFRQNTLLVALIIVFPVIGLEQFLHTTTLEFQRQPFYEGLHWLSDSLLALPLAALAVWAGNWLATRLGIGASRVSDVFTRACMIALILALLLVPGTQATSIRTGMFEFQQRVLPDSIYNRLPSPFNTATYLWGYDVNAASSSNSRPSPSWPGTTVEAQRGTQTSIEYVNNLPRDPALRRLLTIDESIHWADPLNAGHILDFYTGPIPTVVHLHGAEVQSTSDGTPLGWFTNDGRHGPGYFTASQTSANAAIYEYPNKQQSTTLWFHDHVLGLTRINLYGGLAAFYLIRDQFDTGSPNNPLRLPADDQEIELMIQDRQFDTNGQLFFPDGSEADPGTVFNRAISERGAATLPLPDCQWQQCALLPHAPAGCAQPGWIRPEHVADWHGRRSAGSARANC